MKRQVVVCIAITLVCGTSWSQEAPADAPVEVLEKPVVHAFKFLTRAHGNPIGVEVAPVDEALRAQLGVEEGVGVVVTIIAPENNAPQLGLKEHDVVLKFDECPVTSPEKFHELIASEQGKTMHVRVLRQGKPLSVPVTLPKPARFTLLADVELPARAENRYRIGVTLAEADDTLRSQLKLAAGEGLVVTDVVADGPSAKTGIKRHDVLVKLDNKRLSTVEGVNEQVQQVKDRTATVVFLRSGQETSCDVTPQLSTETGARLTRSRILLHLKADQDRSLDSIRVPTTTDLAPGLAPVHVRWIEKPAPAKAAAELARLKQQLAQMQKTLASLEAALQPPAQEQPKPPAKEDR